jgi:glycosyltransferase involved in cell wall biosynthesis
VGRLFSPVAAFRFARLVSWLKKQQFNIVMIYFVDTNQFVLPACRLAGIRSVVINRRDMGYWYREPLVWWLNQINRLAQYFLVNAEAVRQIVVSREKFPANRVKVIYNGLWDWKAAAVPITRAELDVPSEAQLVGIVAGLRQVKRIDRFIAMAEIVLRARPDTCFLVVGDGECKPELAAEVRRLGLEARIRFLGQVSDVQALLPLLDVGVLTSESEGLSNTLIEYAAAGVPAVAFDCGGNREVVEDGYTGFLVPDGDTAGMAGKVISLLADNDLRNRLSVQGKQHVDNRFAPGQILNELYCFFEQITTERSDNRNHPMSD